MRKLQSLWVVFSFLLFSCNLLGSSSGSPIALERFWAINMRTGQFYSLSAGLLVEGRHCDIWVERGAGVSIEQAQLIANEYDNEIYEMMIDAFGMKNFSYLHQNREIFFSDTMAFADWMVDGNGKLTILLLDIRDNYEKGVNDSYVAGYFWASNFLNMTYSNRRSMIYIDTDPGMRDGITSVLFGTLVHEMQHLMNYVTSVIKNRGSMDLWINEGLSAAAEWVYGGNSYGKIDWFVNNGVPERDIKGLIDKGNNFFVWGNRGNENPYAVMDDYSTVYLFFQWLRLQSGGSAGIYRDIISSSKVNYEAVTDAMDGYSDWKTLLESWLAANYINAPNGPYGYMNDPEYKNIKAPFLPVGITSLNLFPGEGVYSYNYMDTLPSSTTGNIRYAGLSNTLKLSISPGDMLLTYNINTNRNAAVEQGSTTGAVPPNVVVSGTTSQGSSGARAVLGSTGRALPSTVPVSVPGPYRIGAEDILGIRD